MKKNKKNIFQILSDTQPADAEFIPILSMDDEDSIQKESIPEELPILPLRNTVLFPGVIIPITVGRDKSIQLVRTAYKNNRIIGVVSQKDAIVEDPVPSDLYNIGTVAYIIKLLQMPDDTVTIIIQGRSRFKIVDFVQSEPYFIAKVEPYARPQKTKGYSKNFPMLLTTVKETAMKLLKDGGEVPTEARIAIENIESPWLLMHMIASNLKLQHVEKQKLLEMTDLEQLANGVAKFN